MLALCLVLAVLAGATSAALAVESPRSGPDHVPLTAGTHLDLNPMDRTVGVNGRLASPSGTTLEPCEEPPADDLVELLEAVSGASPVCLCLLFSW